MLLESLGEDEDIVDETRAETAEPVSTNDARQDSLKHCRRCFQTEGQHSPLIMASLRDERQLLAIAKAHGHGPESAVDAKTGPPGTAARQ